MRHSLFVRRKKKVDIDSYDMITNITVRRLQFRGNFKDSVYPHRNTVGSGVIGEIFQGFGRFLDDWPAEVVIQIWKRKKREKNAFLCVSKKNNRYSIFVYVPLLLSRHSQLHCKSTIRNCINVINICLQVILPLNSVFINFKIYVHHIYIINLNVLIVR